MRTELHSTEVRHAPGQYEIRLQGHLDERWATRFAGLSFSHEQDGTTTLAGPVIDQSALYGLLRTVRDLGLPLIAVTLVECPVTDASVISTDSDAHRLREELEP